MTRHTPTFSKGDLVNFKSNPWVFKGAEKRYKNPGVILNVYRTPALATKTSYEVYWSDGKITNEFEAYIVSSSNDFKEVSGG